MARDDHGPRYGFRDPHAVEATLRIPKWNGRLRVAHLTDLHFGNMTPVALQRAAVALANASRPDLTLLTGDFVARGLSHLERMTDTLGRIEGPKYAVLGNHDHWLDAGPVREALRRADVEVIDNQWTRFGVGEDALALVCMDDYGTGHHDEHAATAHLHDTPALALSHNPESAPLLWGKGVSLVLSGHTHGGQFHVYNWTRAFYEKVLKMRFLDGWYVDEDRQVYVNPGVGSSVVPFRYGRPSMREVAILNLEGGPIAPPEVQVAATLPGAGSATTDPVEEPVEG